MSRPTPQILTQQRIGQTNLEIKIQLGEGHWVVVYADQPINLVKSNYYSDYKKYIRNGFPHEGHAQNLARKLNHQFGTDQFTVKKVI